MHLKQTDLVSSLSWYIHQCFIIQTVESGFQLLPTHFILSLCGPTKTVHWDPFALPFTSVWSCQVSTSRSLGSIDRIHMWWLFRGNWWRTKSRLYVGMKGIFLNKWKIKLWTALELCLFLNFKICWYALNCSCRSLSFCCWKITNVFLKLLCNLLSVLMQNCHICKLHVRHLSFLRN